MKRAVLVNGVPASGKSTVARAISANFGWPLLGLDTIKEPFFEHVGAGDREHNRKLGRASYAAIFNLIAGFPQGSTTVVDAWFGFQPPEVLTGHLKRAGISQTVEIWCRSEPTQIAERYGARVRKRAVGHPGLEYLPELLALARSARPLSLFPLLEIDTNVPLDENGIVDWLIEHLGADKP